jgi:peptidoglycan/xylan/chitin deacetylase (PgdA/CDA1 family)
LTSI